MNSGPIEQTRSGDLVVLRDRMREFTRERDWERFHDPKSLLLALAGEVGEVAELLQWLPEASAADMAAQAPLNTRLGEELSDVLLYLVRLADVCNVDLTAAVHHKLDAAHNRFPPAEVSGVAPDQSAPRVD